jgi:hypothetical protein
MFWIAFTLALAHAVLILPKFVTEDVTTSGSDPIFAGFSMASEVTVTVWVKPFSELSGESVIWEARKSAADGTPSLTLSQTSATMFRGCYNGACREITVQEGLFIWSYLVVSVKSTSLRVCQADWSSRSMTCEEAALSAGTPLLQSDFKVKVYAKRVRFTQVELYSFEFFNTFLSAQTLQAKATAFSCHFVCTTCFGPAPNACNEFTALIGLDEVTFGNSDSLVIPVTDVKFQGRSYSNVESFAVTFWVYFSSSTPYANNLVNFEYPSAGCNSSSEYGFPCVYCYWCYDFYSDFENHSYLEGCNEDYFDNRDMYDGVVLQVRSR